MDRSLSVPDDSQRRSLTALGSPTPAPSPRVPVAVAVLALLGAGLMAMLWLGARSRADDAAIERTALIAERDAANTANIAADAELQTVLDELAEARTATDDAPGAASSADDGLQALEDRIEALTDEVDRLEDDNQSLTAGLETTTGAAVLTTGTNPAPATSPPAQDVGVSSADDTETDTETETETETDIETETASPADIGDQISGLFRVSVLGSGQKLCVGQGVIDELGEKATLEAIESESPSDDAAFVDAVATAANSCNIDPSAVFG